MSELDQLIALVRSVVDDPTATYQPTKFQRSAARAHQKYLDRQRRRKDAEAARRIMAWACPRLLADD